MMPQEPPPRRTRPAPRYRRAEVRRVVRLTPHMVRVTFSGDDFDGFAIAGPTGHVRIFFPPDGERTLTLPIADAGGGAPSLALDRSRSRVYTPRRWDIATQELEVDVVVHGAGP
ncbi:MAG: siderophore-interacting protein, partial [Chloroflexi bacterium]|nr:siderophore-interacting protein [Chloroflexota bacterium]